MDKWFEDFENRTVWGKDNVPWPITIEFEIQRDYFITNLNSLPRLNTANDVELLSTAQYCNNLIGWMDQMQVMGYTGLPAVIQAVLSDTFGNADVLVELRRNYTEKWLEGKSGQYKIGENYFTIQNGTVYYCTLNNEWYEIETNSVFNIMPTQLGKPDAQLIEFLNANHKPTRYQQIYIDWRDAGYTGKTPFADPGFKTGETTPEIVFKDTIQKLENIVRHPLALKGVEQALSDQPNYLEYLIKINCLVADFAEERRASQEHTLYLLRDCAMFNEAQTLIDYLKGEQTSHDQVYLGRQSLSSRKRDAGHWYVAQELLLMSLQRYPNDFDDFYRDFTRQLKDYEAYSEEFSNLVQNLVKYLNNHIDEAIQKQLTINVIDLGFQGSINMLVKYVLDNYCLQDSKLTTKVHMYVVAEWFNDVYKGMVSSDTFSSLTHVEVMARNNAIYEYVPWSLKEGSLKVFHGKEDDQRQADIELAVMAMTILLENQVK